MPATPKTAFVFAGGGSLGAIQVGMLQALVEHGVAADGQPLAFFCAPLCSSRRGITSMKLQGR
jgi:hypothetical protein